MELTAGGGGNSETRVQKLRVKNEKLQEERVSSTILYTNLLDRISAFFLNALGAFNPSDSYTLTPYTFFPHPKQKIHEQSIVPAKAALAASSYARAKDDADNPDVSSERARAARPAAKAEPVRRVKRAASGVNAIRSSVQRSWAVNSEK